MSRRVCGIPDDVRQVGNANSQYLNRESKFILDSWKRVITAMGTKL